MRAQIGTLILATSGIQLANGFFGTFISLRVAIEDFDATMAGLVLSSYFAGFTLGALRCGRIIERSDNPRLRRLRRAGRRRDRGHAALGRTATLASSARGRRVRLRWALYHDRKLA
jgi:MFS family permease